MAASDHLQPGQFRMPMERFRDARSSDFGVPLHEVMPHLEAERRNYQNNGWPEPHPGHVAHGGPRGYVDHLKESIQREGLRVPPTVNDRGPRAFLADGHHRGLALIELGGDEVVVRGGSTQKKPWLPAEQEHLR